MTDQQNQQKKQMHEELGWEHPLTAEDQRFLQPVSLRRELWRATKIFWECAKGFYAFRHLNNCVTVFGSARFNEIHPYYQMARHIGQLLAQNNYIVMTGGGPGIMEAANRGAKDSGGRTVGCNIRIPAEQQKNLYLDQWITFKYFFVRKVMLTIHSRAFVVLPGGFGTLDEFFEMATLMQTEKTTDLPMVLMGVDYWKPLVDYMHNTMAKSGTIDYDDAAKIFLTDSPEEAIHFIRNHKQNGK